MLLAIDIGNTNTVFALFAGDDRLVASWRLETNAKRSQDEYAAFLMPLLAAEGASFSDVSDVLVGSVVPQAKEHIQRFCKAYLACAPVFVSADNAGVSVKLDQPQQIGADRLINAVAVKQRYSLPAIVVDFGTATTFDVIDADGAYIGGAIAPGIRLSVAALAAAAAKLPAVDVVKTSSAIGTNTEDAIQSGIYWGYVGLVSGILSRIKADLGMPVQSVIATGGLAPLFTDDVDAITNEDQTLTLQGLLTIYKGYK